VRTPKRPLGFVNRIAVYSGSDFFLTSAHLHWLAAGRLSWHWPSVHGFNTVPCNQLDRYDTVA